MEEAIEELRNQGLNITADFLEMAEVDGSLPALVEAISRLEKRTDLLREHVGLDV